MAPQKRFSDALFISAGACNPSGMAHSLVNACRECVDEGVAQQDDPAVRLIVSQIAFICGIWDGVADFSRGPDFSTCTRDCEKKEAEKNADTLEGQISAIAQWSASAARCGE